MSVAEQGTPENEVHVRVDSPIGALVVWGTADAVTKVALPGSRAARDAPSAAGRRRGATSDAARQLDEYFAGKRRAFDLPIEVAGTEFQEQVWLKLAEIPYGDTISYAELARWVGRPQAFRAVGQANGANPIPIILPCHRVIAADGSIGGYGGGLETKRRLLAIEGRG